jgi:hypothetical protein
MADLDSDRERPVQSARTRAVPVVLLAAATLGAACRGPCHAPHPDTVRIIGPRGGEVASSDGVVRLAIPSGALARETEISIRALDAFAESIPGGVAGTAYEFKPDGLSFARPARLTIRYAAGRLPRGAAESSLALAKIQDDGRLQLTPEVRVDEVNKTVTGSISGFSRYAVVAPCTLTSVTFEPAEPWAEHLLPGDFRFCAGPGGAPARIDGWIPEEEPR